MNLAGECYVNAKASSMKMLHEGVCSKLYALIPKIKRLHCQKQQQQQNTAVNVQEKYNFS